MVISGAVDVDGVILQSGGWYERERKKKDTMKPIRGIEGRLLGCFSAMKLYFHSRGEREIRLRRETHTGETGYASVHIALV